MHIFDENNQRKRCHYFEKEKWVGEGKDLRERKQGVLEGRKKRGPNFVL